MEGARPVVRRRAPYTHRAAATERLIACGIWALSHACVVRAFNTTRMEYLKWLFWVRDGGAMVVRLFAAPHNNFFWLNTWINVGNACTLMVRFRRQKTTKHISKSEKKDHAVARKYLVSPHWRLESPLSVTNRQINICIIFEICVLCQHSVLFWEVTGCNLDVCYFGTWLPVCSVLSSAELLRRAPASASETYQLCWHGRHIMQLPCIWWNLVVQQLVITSTWILRDRLTFPALYANKYLHHRDMMPIAVITFAEFSRRPKILS